MQTKVGPPDSLCYSPNRFSQTTVTCTACHMYANTNEHSLTHTRTPTNAHIKQNIHFLVQFLVTPILWIGATKNRTTCK